MYKITNISNKSHWIAPFAQDEDVRVSLAGYDTVVHLEPGESAIANFPYIPTWLKEQIDNKIVTVEDYSPLAILSKRYKHETK